MGNPGSKLEHDGLAYLQTHAVGVSTLLHLAKPVVIPVTDAYWFDLLTSVRFSCDDSTPAEPLLSVLKEHVVAPLRKILVAGPKLCFVSFYGFAVRFDPLTHNVATLLHFHAKMLKTFRLSLLGGRLPFSARCLLHLSFLTHLVVLQYTSTVPMVNLIAQTSYPYDDDAKNAEGQMGKSLGLLEAIRSAVCKKVPQDLWKLDEHSINFSVLSDTSRPTIPQEDFHDYLKQWTQEQLSERKAAHDLKRLSGHDDMVEPLTLPIVPLRLSMIPRVPPLKGCMLTRWMMELVLLVEGVTLSGISPSLKRHTASVSGVLLLCVLSLKTVSLSPCEKEKGAPTYPLLEGFIEQFQSWERVPRRDPAGEDDDHSTLVGRFLQALLVLAVPANVTDTPADLEIFRHILSLMPVIDETTNDMIPEPDPEISARLQMIETINDADIHPTVTGMNHGGLHKLECPIPSGLTAGAALTLLLSLVNWLAPTLLLDERLVDGAQVIKWEQITDCQTNKTSAASQLISPFSKAFTDLPDLVPSLKVALPVLLASSDRPGTLELLYFILAGRPELLPLCRDHFSPSVIADLCDDLASGDSDTRKVVVWLSLVMLIADRSWWATGSKQVAYEIPEWLGQWRYATPSLSTLLLLSVLKRCHLTLRSLGSPFARQTIRLCASIIINSGGGLVDPDRGFAERLASSGSFWLRSTAKSLASWRTVDWTLLETHVVLTRAILYCCGSLLVSDTNVNVAQCAYCQLRLLSDPLASLQDTIASLRWPKSELSAEIAEIDRLVAGGEKIVEPPTAGSVASAAACCHLLPLIRGHMSLQASLRPKEHASVGDILVHITRQIQEPEALCVLLPMFSPPLTIGISSDVSCHRLPSVANGSVIVHQPMFSI